MKVVKVKGHSLGRCGMYTCHMPSSLIQGTQVQSMRLNNAIQMLARGLLFPFSPPPCRIYIQRRNFGYTAL